MRTMLFGGDGRTLFLARLFKTKGQTEIWGLDSLGIESANMEFASVADIIILPYPCFNGEMLRSPMSALELSKECLLELCAGKTVFAGAPSADFLEKAKKSGTRVFDYATEDLLKDNAYITAEGALGIALSDMPRAVRGAKILVLGCGRIGRELAILLKKVGAEVTVTAMREESKLWAKENRLDFVQTDCVLSSEIQCYSGVFNTVPMASFGEREIAKTAADCLLVELASRPGGIDTEAAKSMGRKFINAQGLPGKIAPKSASEIIYREIDRILKSEEI